MRREGEGRGGRGEVDGREREGPKLLLNQDSSETCYATAQIKTELEGRSVERIPPPRQLMLYNH